MNKLLKLTTVLLTFAVACSKKTTTDVEDPPSGLLCFEYNYVDSTEMDIAIINADGTGFHRLNINNFINGYYSSNKSPSFSPNKTKIVFSSNRNGIKNDFEIYSMNIDGSNILNLTNNPFRNEHSPSISPNGQKLLYVAKDNNGDEQIYISQVDGTSEQPVTNFSHPTPFPTAKVRIYYPVWSKDGEKIAFCSDIQYRTGINVFIINSNGTGLSALTTDINGRNWKPTFSPNGQKIAYHQLDPSGNNSQLFVSNISGGNRIQLTDFNHPLGVYSLDPVWSTQGKFIAFLSNKDNAGLNQGFDIYIIKDNGSNLERLTNSNTRKANLDWK